MSRCDIRDERRLSVIGWVALVTSQSTVSCKIDTGIRQRDSMRSIKKMKPAITGPVVNKNQDNLNRDLNCDLIHDLNQASFAIIL